MQGTPSSERLTEAQVRQAFNYAVALVTFAQIVELQVCPRIFIEVLDGKALSLNDEVLELTDAHRRIVYKHMLKIHKGHRT